MRATGTLLILFSAVLVCAQPTPTLTAPPNTVYVSAEGRYEAAPDTALLQFNISVQEDTAKAAYDRAARAAGQIRQVLAGSGIEPKNAEIGFFSVAPVYDWRQPKRKLAGYRVTSAVTLRLKDFNQIPSLVQRLAEIDVTENESLQFILENMEAAKIKAVEDAYGRAHKEAEAVAKSGARVLGELSYSSVDTYEQVRVLSPRPLAMRAAAATGQTVAPPTAEFTPQHIVVTAHVNALFVLK